MIVVEERLAGFQHGHTLAMNRRGVEQKCGSGGAFHFRGVPFAASTAGKNRFLPPQPRAPFQTPPQTRAATVNILGQNHDARNAKEATLIVLRELARRDPSFLARCIGHPDNVGRKRAYIGRNTEDLFPDHPDLRELHEEIADGFLLNTNLSNASKQGVLRMACEVAGLTYGREVRVSF